MHPKNNTVQIGSPETKISVTLELPPDASPEVLADFCELYHELKNRLGRIALATRVRQLAPLS